MRVVLAVLVVTLVVLQYRLWVGEGSFAEVRALQRDIAAQRSEIERMKRRNAALQAEVDDLKEGLEAVEARARSELGMIREGEVFYQIPEPPRRAAR
ncbi:MAG: cell division protein FtsB [Chromatiales bacterium]